MRDLTVIAGYIEMAFSRPETTFLVWPDLAVMFCVLEIKGLCAQQIPNLDPVWPEIEPAAVSRFDRDGRPVTAETLPH
ncbi:MAG: hypothetical protein ACPIC3_06235, partial [Candidatus Puniceispirillaceae bacterium]